MDINNLEKEENDLKKNKILRKKSILISAFLANVLIMPLSSYIHYLLLILLLPIIAILIHSRNMELTFFQCINIALATISFTLLLNISQLILMKLTSYFIPEFNLLSLLIMLLISTVYLQSSLYSVIYLFLSVLIIFISASIGYFIQKLKLFNKIRMRKI